MAFRAGNCTTYHCYKGGPAEAPEGLETGGCPLYSHPAQLTDNRNCVLCMVCLKACPHKRYPTPPSPTPCHSGGITQLLITAHATRLHAMSWELAPMYAAAYAAAVHTCNQALPLRYVWYDALLTTWQSFQHATLRTDSAKAPKDGDPVYMCLVTPIPI